jgi:hypothetical protein
MDYDFYYINWRMQGRTPLEACGLAEKDMGGPTLMSILARRALCLGALVEERRKAQTRGQKRATMLVVKDAVPCLYASDVCEKHLAFVLRTAVATALRSRGMDMAGFYELVQKDLRKSGCNECTLLHD